MNKFQKDRIEKIEKVVHMNLNAFNSDRAWTKDQIANIIIFLGNHYRVQYFTANYISIYDLDNNFIETFYTYMDFIDWYNDLVFSN